MGRRIKGLEGGSRPTLNRAVPFPLLHRCYIDARRATGSSRGSPQLPPPAPVRARVDLIGLAQVVDGKRPPAGQSVTSMTRRARSPSGRGAARAPPGDSRHGSGRRASERERRQHRDPDRGILHPSRSAGSRGAPGSGPTAFIRYFPDNLQACGNHTLVAWSREQNVLRRHPMT